MVSVELYIQCICPECGMVMWRHEKYVACLKCKKKYKTPTIELEELEGE